MSLTFLQTAVQDKRMSFLGSELLQVNVFCAITILLLGVQTIVTRKKEHSSNKINRRAKPSIVIASQPVAASTSTTPLPRRVQHASHDPCHYGLNSWYFFAVHLPRTLVMVTNTAVCGQSIRLYV